MKLDAWEAVSSILEAGGRFLVDRYCLINDKGHYHREDGPAVIYPNGNQFWCRDDVLHREGGPAVIRSNGEQSWYRNGKRHRDDGPAIIDPDGLSIGTAMACFIGMTGLLSSIQMVAKNGTGMVTFIGMTGLLSPI